VLGSSNYGSHWQQHFALLRHLDSFLVVDFESSLVGFDFDSGLDGREASAGKVVVGWLR